MSYVEDRFAAPKKIWVSFLVLYCILVSSTDVNDWNEAGTSLLSLSMERIIFKVVRREDK
jgi:hypothetical protein